LSNNLYDLVKNIDFAELCITSEAQVFYANKNEQEIIVEPFKAEGKK